MSEVVDLTASAPGQVKVESAPSVHKFEIAGQPVALARHRFNKNNHGLWGPKDREHRYFVDTISRLFPEARYKALFAAGIPVSINIKFYMKRPNDHFKTRQKKVQRDVSMLKPQHLPTSDYNPVATRPDIDNLVKFILDCCTGVLYEDDTQVVKLVVTKMYDNHRNCEGRTVVQFKQFLH